MLYLNLFFVGFGSWIYPLNLYRMLYLNAIKIYNRPLFCRIEPIQNVVFKSEPPTNATLHPH